MGMYNCLDFSIPTAEPNPNNSFDLSITKSYWIVYLVNTAPILDVLLSFNRMMTPTSLRRNVQLANASCVYHAE